MPVGEWRARWIGQHHGADNSRALYERVLANHIQPAIGDLVKAFSAGSSFSSA